MFETSTFLSTKSCTSGQNIGLRVVTKINANTQCDVLSKFCIPNMSFANYASTKRFKN